MRTLKNDLSKMAYEFEYNRLKEAIYVEISACGLHAAILRKEHIKKLKYQVNNILKNSVVISIYEDAINDYNIKYNIKHSLNNSNPTNNQLSLF